MLNWLVEEKSIAPHAFPSFLQGGRTKPTEMPPLDAPVGEMFVEFAAKPTFDNFLMFFQFANAFGFPPGARQSVLSAIQALRAEIVTTNPVLVQGALQLAAYVAAGNRDVELAAVATVALERLGSTLDTERLMCTAVVSLECAAAPENRREALVTLAVAWKTWHSLPPQRLFLTRRITSATERNRICMAQHFPKIVRTLYRCIWTWTFDRVTNNDAAVHSIERQHHEICNSGYGSPTQSYQSLRSRNLRPPCSKCGRPLSRSLTEQIFIFPTGFARLIAGWLEKSGIPASARIATLKCSRWASCPLSDVNL
jgi:hypothetical protein